VTMDMPGQDSCHVYRGPGGAACGRHGGLIT
jgi:hypothetical protein